MTPDQTAWAIGTAAVVLLLSVAVLTAWTVMRTPRSRKPRRTARHRKTR